MLPEGSAFSRGPVSSTTSITFAYGPGHVVAGIGVVSNPEIRKISALVRIVWTHGVPAARGTRGSTCSGSAPAADGKSAAANRLMRCAGAAADVRVAADACASAN